MPACIPQVNICFEIDANGILKCSARELATGNKNGIAITEHSGRLSKGEIQRMVKEAEKYKSADEEYRHKVKAMNDLEKYALEMKRLLNCPWRKIGPKDEKNGGCS